MKMFAAAGPAPSDEKIECIRGSTSDHIILPAEVKALFLEMSYVRLSYREMVFFTLPVVDAVPQGIFCRIRAFNSLKNACSS